MSTSPLPSGNPSPSLKERGQQLQTQICQLIEDAADLADTAKEHLLGVHPYDADPDQAKHWLYVAGGKIAYAAYLIHEHTRALIAVDEITLPDEPTFKMVSFEQSGTPGSVEGGA